MTLADWPSDERPRERLLKHGAAALSKAELLAIFLRTGIAGRTAIELGQDLMVRFGGLNRLSGASLDEIATIRGLGPAKYVQLQAVVEMVRRSLSEDMGERDSMASPRAVRDFVGLTNSSRRRSSRRYRWWRSRCSTTSSWPVPVWCRSPNGAWREMHGSDVS